MKKVFFLSILFLTFTMTIPDTTLSAPAAQQLVVNDRTKQCGFFWIGDEFHVCDLPDDWKYSKICPDGYESVGKVKGVNCQETEWVKQHKGASCSPYP